MQEEISVRMHRERFYHQYIKDTWPQRGEETMTHKSKKGEKSAVCHSSVKHLNLPRLVQKARALSNNCGKCLKRSSWSILFTPFLTFPHITSCPLFLITDWLLCFFFNDTTLFTESQRGPLGDFWLLVLITCSLTNHFMT